MNFYFVTYYIFYILTHEQAGEIQKKKRKLNIYTSQTHTQLHTDKKETKKHTPSTFFSIYVKKKLIKINNK